jgi:hypothetical protein
MRLTGIVFFYFCSLLPLLEAPLGAQTGPLPGKRSFNEIFPGIAPSVRQAVFSNEGYSKPSVNIPRSSLVGGVSGSGIDPQIIESVFAKKPGFLVESINVVPGAEGGYSLLDVYNALGNIRGLKGRLYHSASRNEKVALFEDVTRIESPKKNTPVADPPPAARIPPSETIYMRLKDANFGNSFYRGDIALFQRGLRYSLTNYKNITYFFITVIKEEMFTVQFYFEVISEGVLIYSLAGADVSDFVSSRIDMPSAINKRLAVIISWAAEGITERSGALP